VECGHFEDRNLLIMLGLRAFHYFWNGVERRNGQKSISVMLSISYDIPAMFGVPFSE